MTRSAPLLFLATDMLVAAFDNSNKSHLSVGRQLRQFSEQGFEPVYAYPALVELYNKVTKSKNKDLRKRLNSVLGEIAKGPLIKMPISEDVVLGSLFADRAVEKGWEISFSDLVILAMAYRMDSPIVTDQEDLSTLASSLDRKTSF